MLRFQGIDKRMKITQVRGLYFNLILNGGGLKLKSKLPFWIELVYEPVNVSYFSLLPHFITNNLVRQSIK